MYSKLTTIQKSSVVKKAAGRVNVVEQIELGQYFIVYGESLVVLRCAIDTQ